MSRQSGHRKVAEILRNLSFGEDARLLNKCCGSSIQNGDFVGNATALAFLLRQVGKGRALLVGRYLHSQIIHWGYDRDTFLGNCLIQMYGSCGSMKEAQSTFDIMCSLNLHSWNILMNAYGQNVDLEAATRVFSRMPNRDVVSWNGIIATLVQNGHGKEALHIFCQMQLENAKPNEITFVCALDSCASLAALEVGLHIHAIIMDSGYCQDMVVGNALLNMYGKCGSVQNARRVFGGHRAQDVVSWTTMIAVFVQNGHSNEALNLFHQMQTEGIESNNITALCALDACASLQSLRYGSIIHAAIIYSNYGESVAVDNGLIKMYGTCGSVDNAKEVFSRMHHSDVVSWNAMIAAFIQNERANEALDLFQQMQLVKPDNVTYLCAVHACTCLAAIEDGRKVHALIVHNGVSQNLLLETALINMYGKCGSVHDARQVFSGLSQQDIICWNAMTAAYAQNEQGKEVLDLFHQMQLQGVQPDCITIVCALDASADLADFEEGKDIHAFSVENECVYNTQVGTAIMNMYGRCGSVRDAEYVFVALPHRDIVAWTAMMAAFTQNGHLKEACDLFEQMQLKGIKPDESTFVCMLTACSYMGLVDEGRHFFVSLSKVYGMIQTTEHYVCMIDLLGRAGLLTEAEDILSRMCFHNASLAWRCLLGACGIHGDLSRGLRVARHCFRLDPDNYAVYVSLYNLYCLDSK